MFDSAGRKARVFEAATYAKERTASDMAEHAATPRSWGREVACPLGLSHDACGLARNLRPGP